MPGGIYDSSKTRVAPVFDQLSNRKGEWVRELLTVPGLASPADVDLGTIDLRFTGKPCWGRNEEALQPPVSLLSWLIRHPNPALHNHEHPGRKELADGNPEALAAALQKLRSGGLGSAWYVLEGATCPDAFLVTPDALIVVEGKRTEPGPTRDTTWMPGRHQIWRHIDAAWEIRGRRQVFGFFIVEGTPPGGDLPPIWADACTESLSTRVLHSSLPHRGSSERDAIARCFLGAATWQAVCRHCGIDFGTLPDRIDPLPRLPA